MATHNTAMAFADLHHLGQLRDTDAQFGLGAASGTEALLPCGVGIMAGDCHLDQSPVAGGIWVWDDVQSFHGLCDGGGKGFVIGAIDFRKARRNCSELGSASEDLWHNEGGLPTIQLGAGNALLGWWYIGFDAACGSVASQGERSGWVLRTGEHADGCVDGMGDGVCDHRGKLSVQCLFRAVAGHQPHCPGSAMGGVLWVWIYHYEFDRARDEGRAARPCHRESVVDVVLGLAERETLQRHFGWPTESHAQGRVLSRSLLGRMAAGLAFGGGCADVPRVGPSERFAFCPESRFASGSFVFAGSPVDPHPCCDLSSPVLYQTPSTFSIVDRGQTRRETPSGGTGNAVIASGLCSSVGDGWIVRSICDAVDRCQDPLSGSGDLVFARFGDAGGAVWCDALTAL